MARYYCLYEGAEQSVFSFRVERSAGRAVDNATLEVVRSKTVTVGDEVYITVSPIDLSNLTALYNLDNDVKDWSASANHGTATDITYTPGFHEKAAIFNGTTSKIVLPHHTGNNFGTSSFSLFFEVDFTSTSNMTVIDKYGNSGWSIRLENGYVKIYVKNSGGTQYTYTSTYLINDGNFHHINVVRSYGVGWYIYVDGVIRDTVTNGAVLPNDIDFNINTSVTFGYSPSLGGYYSGDLDQTFWMKRAITSGEASTYGSGLDHPVTIFGGEVIDREYKIDRISVKCEGFGKKIRDKFVESKKYYNQLIEDIIEDLILTSGTGDVLNGLGFTYASTWSTGITLKEFVAFGQMADIITELSRSVGVDFHITYNKLFHFEPSSEGELEWIATVGSNVRASEWQIRDNEIINVLYLLGGSKRYTNSETFTSTASQTVFTLQYVPEVVEVFVDPAGGTNYTRKSPDVDYTVDPEGKKITFLTGQALNAKVKIDYEYDQPIFLKTQDSTSMTTYGEKARKINAEWVNNIDDARRYANGLLNYYKNPRLMGRITYTGIKADIAEASIIRVVDSYATPAIDQTMDVKSVTWKYPEGVTEFEVGTWTPRVFEWQKEIMLKIRDLERRAAAVSELRRFVQLEETISITDTATVTQYTSNQFRVAAGTDKHLLYIDFDNVVTDKSGSGHDGTVVGATYRTGYRRGCLSFDGIDDYVSLANNISVNVNTDSFVFVARVYPIYQSQSPGFASWFIIVDGAGSANVGFSIDTSSSSTFGVKAWANGNATILTSVSCTYNAWHEIKVVYTAGGTTRTVYLDNVLLGTDTTGTIPNVNTTFRIGTVGGYTQTGKGYIDEAHIFKVNPTSQQLTNIYNYGDLVSIPARVGKSDIAP